MGDIFIQTKGFAPLRMPGADTQGSSAEVTRLPPVNEPERIVPREGHISPNFRSKHHRIAINGMNMTPDSIHAMGQSLADMYGRPVYMIPNHTDGVVIDIRHCIAAAFSSKKGIQVENSSAKYLIEELARRRNDSDIIEIDAYSQGSLITRNVLVGLRDHLKQEGRENEWKKLASRIRLCTYGAATHEWPQEIRVNALELRHIGDGVANPVGETVSAIQRIDALVKGDLTTGRPETIVLPVMRDAHSIQNYLQRFSEFYEKRLRQSVSEPRTKATVEQRDVYRKRAQILIDDMRNKQGPSTLNVSSVEFNTIIRQLVSPALDESTLARPRNRAILMARELATLLVQHRDTALSQLSPTTLDEIIRAGQTPFKRETPHRSTADRRQRPLSSTRGIRYPSLTRDELAIFSHLQHWKSQVIPKE